MRKVSKKGYLAVKQPEFKKIEATIKGGVALISQRIDLIKTDLVMDYEIDGLVLKANKDKILLRGDSGLQPWAKQVLNTEGLEFVLCPETNVIGYEILE
jgi:hypothetical protein